MQNTKYTKSNIERYGYEIVSGPHVMVSNSSILEKVTGQNWLAVGDASVTFDPLSSNGIITAINNALNAANKIAEHFKSKHDCFEDYGKKLSTAFYNYLVKRNYYYNLERRWQNDPFSGNKIKNYRRSDYAQI